MDIFYTQKLKLYNSLGHMIMKDDVEFLKLLAEKLKNQPIIDGLDVNYIDRLLSIGNNDGQWNYKEEAFEMRDDYVRKINEIYEEHKNKYVSVDVDYDELDKIAIEYLKWLKD